MDFRLELNIKPFENQVNIRDHIMLVGSCFTDHISKRLSQYKFHVLENPNGILFNPASISHSISNYINGKKYKGSDLFYFNELWNSWEHHSVFSHPGKRDCLDEINDSVELAHEFLSYTNWIIITLGSSFVYELKDDSLGGVAGYVAANCHKVPAQHFNHRLLSFTEVENYLESIVLSLKQYIPGIKIVFTISPVRHSREGLVENNRSKALLHSGVHSMIQNHENVFYFPSYELVIDDLRDYRFYAEDLIHPNYQATNYVWEKFSEAVIDEESRLLMKQLHPIHLALNHRAMHPGSAQHKKFLNSMLEKTKQLMDQFPFLDLSEEKKFFSVND
jgi:hypothetical protein